MSIITEALKKAQKKQSPILPEGAKKYKQPKIGPTLISAQNKQAKKYHSKKNTFILGGFFFGALLLMVLVIILTYFQNVQKGYFRETAVNSLSPSYMISEKEPLLKIEPETNHNTPKIFKEEKEEIFKLSGIVQDGDKPLAVINDRILQIGEIINGATITDINNDTVKLSFKGESITLYLSN